MLGTRDADIPSMVDRPPMLRDLYPDATVDVPLRGYRPPRTGISARAWAYFVYSIVAFVGVTVLLVWLLDKAVADETLNRWFGGSGVITYDTDGDPQTLDGTWLPPIWGGLLAIAAVTYGLLRLHLKPPWRRERRIPWQRWATERGFRLSGPHAIPTTVRFGVLRDGRDRDWMGPWVGRIGEFTVRVGATAWTTGRGRSTERHHAYFLHAEAPSSRLFRLPGSSVTQFLRGFSDFDIDVAGTELRLESIDLDLNCEIRVDGGDEVIWHQVFDPSMVEALATELDVQWCQRGRHFLFVAGGRRHATAPVETLDTMCRGAEFVLRRYVDVADRSTPTAPVRKVG